MPTPPIKYQVDTDELNRILRNLPGKREENNRAVAFAIEGKAKQKAPTDTSALKNSIYVVCGDQDGYSQAAAEARKANPKAEVQPLPKPAGEDAHVGPSVDYGFYQELGTRFMGAHPFLIPAVLESVDELRRVW